MDDIDIDFSELDEFQRDLGRLPRGFMGKVERITNRGAFNIKRDWKERWEGYEHIPHLPNAISYDVKRRGHKVTSEIGPDKNRRQGPLGNLIEFGSLNNAPIPGGVPALAEEAPKYERALADLGEQEPVARGMG